MKKQVIKKSKKLLCLALSMTLLAGIFCTTGLFAKAEEHAYTKDTVLAENNYTDALKPSQGPRSDEFYKYSGDLSPAAAPGEATNTVLWYTQNWYGFGMALLGHNYKTPEVSERITVKAGVTYKVDFDLYTTGTATSAMEIGLAVGANELRAGSDGKTIDETNYKDYLKLREVVASYPKGASRTGSWEACSETITVPADADVTTKNVLYIYFQAGQGITAYIDNVKVTALAGVDVDYVVGDTKVSACYPDGKIPAALPSGIAEKDAKGNELVLYTDAAYKTVFSAENYTRTDVYAKITLYGKYQEPEKEDTVIAENNYDGALITKNDEGGPRTSTFFKYSGDLSPAAAPDAASNTVLWYRQNYHGLGLALLGHDYKSGPVSDRVQVKAGTAYKVEFAFYTNGTTTSDMEIGLAVGADSYEEGFTQNAKKWQNGLGETSYASYLKLVTPVATFAKGVTLSEKWENRTAYITIPEGMDVTTDNALYIYMLSGGKANVFIDNVKVTELAGVTVDYVVGDKTVSAYYPDGNIPAELPDGIAAKNADKKELVLYTDAAYTTAFSAESYKRTGKTAKVTLYGRYEEKKKENTVVAENDYQTATKPADSWAGGFYNYSGDLYPAAAPDDANNTALWYHPQRCAVGLALLGHDYVSGKVTNRVKVEAGLTYKVEFSMYTKGTAAENLEFGLAVAADNFEGKIDETNYTSYLSLRKKIKEIQAGTALTEGWNKYTAYITVPEDADVTTNNALYIYLKGGSTKADVYIDNVKVTETTEIPGTGDESVFQQAMLYAMLVTVFGAAIVVSTCLKVREDRKRK